MTWYLDRHGFECQAVTWRKAWSWLACLMFYLPVGAIDTPRSLTFAHLQGKIFQSIGLRERIFFVYTKHLTFLSDTFWSTNKDHHTDDIADVALWTTRKLLSVKWSHNTFLWAVQVLDFNVRHSRILRLWFCIHTCRWMNEAGLAKPNLEKSGSWGW